MYGFHTPPSDVLPSLCRPGPTLWSSVGLVHNLVRLACNGSVLIGYKMQNRPYSGHCIPCPQSPFTLSPLASLFSLSQRANTVTSSLAILGLSPRNVDLELSDLIGTRFRRIDRLGRLEPFQITLHNGK